MQLIRWQLWCDIQKQQDSIRQIHNNIRSLALARAAGYQSPGWREVGVNSWLKAWGDVVGKDGIRKILDEQNVLQNKQYAAVLEDL